MPKGPQGQKRKADVVGNAVQIARIATGEVEDAKRPASKDYTRKGGIKGGKARAKSLTPKKRTTIAKKGAMTRWGRHQGQGGVQD